MWSRLAELAVVPLPLPPHSGITGMCCQASQVCFFVVTGFRATPRAFEHSVELKTTWNLVLLPHSQVLIYKHVLTLGPIS